MSDLTETLYTDPNLAQFYDFRASERNDLDCVENCAQSAGTVLDLGCGTGELATRLASSRKVVAVDPSSAMIKIAQLRFGSGRVRWVEGDARSLRLGEKFDLVVLTGHTFQVFLNRPEQRAVINTIAAHLKPDGRFLFDSRNPDFPERKSRTREETLRRFIHPMHGPVEAWNESSFDESTQILHYRNSYRLLVTGRLHSATARILYTPKPVIETLLQEAGLAVDHLWGDWTGAPFQPTAREIIVSGRPA